MGKRQAKKQLTMDNFDDDDDGKEDEVEGSGAKGFSVASEDVLRGRKIAVGKRRVTKPGGAAAAGAGLFSAFSFTKPATTSTVTVSTPAASSSLSVSTVPTAINGHHGHNVSLSQHTFLTSTTTTSNKKLKEMPTASASISVTSGKPSVVVGGGSEAVRQGSVSMGGGSEAVGGGRVAVGGGSEAVRQGNVLMGGGSIAVGGGSVAVGGGRVAVAGTGGSVAGRGNEFISSVRVMNESFVSNVSQLVSSCPVCDLTDMCQRYVTMMTELRLAYNVTDDDNDPRDQGTTGAGIDNQSGFAFLGSVDHVLASRNSHKASQPGRLSAAVTGSINRHKPVFKFGGAINEDATGKDRQQLQPAATKQWTSFGATATSSTSSPAQATGFTFTNTAGLTTSHEPSNGLAKQQIPKPLTEITISKSNMCDATKMDTPSSGFAFGKSSTTDVTKTDTPSSGFAFGKSSTTDATKTDTLSSGFAFGKSSTTDVTKMDTPSTGFTFGKSSTADVTKTDTPLTGFTFGKSSTADVTKTDTPSTGFTFGKSSTADVTKTDTPSTGFTFGKSSTADVTKTDTPSTGFTFGKSSTADVTKTDTPSTGFTFGKSSTTDVTKTDTPSTGFTFGKSSTTDVTKSDAPPSTGGFTFSGPAVGAVANTNSTAASGVQGDDDGEYVPPVAEVKQITEEDSMFSVKCKLFYQHGGEYKDKGVGMLYLKPSQSPGGKVQLLVRADTNLGNILLNILLVADMQISRVGKNNVMLVCVSNPPLDVKGGPGPRDPVPMLMRVKGEQQCDALLLHMKTAVESAKAQDAATAAAAAPDSDDGIEETSSASDGGGGKSEDGGGEDSEGSEDEGECSESQNDGNEDDDDDEIVCLD